MRDFKLSSTVLESLFDSLADRFLQMFDQQIDTWCPEQGFIQFELFAHVAEQSQAWEERNLLLSGNALAQNLNDAVQFPDE